MFDLHNSSIIGDYNGFVNAYHEGIDLNTSGDFGWSPLNLSILWGHTKCVEFILSHGGDPNRKDRLGNILLHVATRNNVIDSVRLLLDVGADVYGVNDDGLLAKALTTDAELISLIEEYENPIKEPDS